MKCVYFNSHSVPTNKKRVRFKINSPSHSFVTDDREDIDHLRLEVVVCVVTIASGLVSGAGGIEASRLIKDVALGL